MCIRDRAIPAETMVMYAKESDKGIRLSVCDPNLNIEEKTYTTKEMCIRDSCGACAG